MKIKLIKEYEDYKVGKIYEVDDEGGKQLIEMGVAEVFIPKIDLDEVAEKVAEKAQAMLDADKEKTNKENADKDDKTIKMPAQARDHDLEKKGGFPTMGHFFKSVIKSSQSPNRPDDAMQKFFNIGKATGMSELVNADGGFLIPTDFSTALLEAEKEVATIAPRCMNLPINNTVELPFVNNTSHSTSWTGGVRLYKPGEGAEKTASKPSIAKAELKLHKMTALIYATDELISDSPMALQQFLTTMVSTEVALTKDEDIINGTGAGEALGILNSPALVTQAKEGSQTADTIVSENLMNMWSRLYNKSRKNAIWLINQDCMDQICGLTIPGTSGVEVVYVKDASQAIPGTIFGAPLVWSEHCQTLGDAGDIILGDFSQYLTATKAGSDIEMATSIHVKFVYDETAFRFVYRFDGQPWWASPVTPKHSTATVSPFVTLAARA